jgi:ABC-type uncharacterized transport system permease subunit
VNTVTNDGFSKTVNGHRLLFLGHIPHRSRIQGFGLLRALCPVAGLASMTMPMMAMLMVLDRYQAGGSEEIDIEQ